MVYLGTFEVPYMLQKMNYTLRSFSDQNNVTLFHNLSSLVCEE